MAVPGGGNHGEGVILFWEGSPWVLGHGKAVFRSACGRWVASDEWIEKTDEAGRRGQCGRLPDIVVRGVILLSTDGKWGAWGLYGISVLSPHSAGVWVVVCAGDVVAEAGVGVGGGV